MLLPDATTTGLTTAEAQARLAADGPDDMPLQPLSINLVTDGLPALALVMDPVSPDALTRPPRRTDQPMLGRHQWARIAAIGLLEAIVTLSVFAWALRSRDLGEARNLAFSVLVFGELLRAFAARSDRKLFWEVGAFSNLELLGVVIGSVIVQLGIHHVPATQGLFGLSDLPLADCGLALLLGLIPVTVLELTKLVRRLWAHSPGDQGAKVTA